MGVGFTLPADGLALPADFAGRRQAQARQQAQQAGLAGPVGAFHAQQLARPELEAQPAEQAAVAADAGEIVDLQHVRAQKPAMIVRTEVHQACAATSLA